MYRRVLFTLAVLLAGCIGSPDLAGQTTVDAGTFFEINMDVQEGDTIRWEWGSQGPVEFDVHSHDPASGQTVEHATAGGERGAGNFTPEYSGTYSLLWSAGDRPVELDYRVWGDFEVRSYYPPR